MLVLEKLEQRLEYAQYRVDDITRFSRSELELEYLSDAIRDRNDARDQLRAFQRQHPDKRK